MSEEFEAKLKALSPEDRQAVKDGFTYKLDREGGRSEYARGLQDAVDKRQVKAGEAQSKITALPWVRVPT